MKKPLDLLQQYDSVGAKILATDLDGCSDAQILAYGELTTRRDALRIEIMRQLALAAAVTRAIDGRILEVINGYKLLL